MQIYHETLSSAVNESLAEIALRGAVLRDAEEITRVFEFGGISYGQNKEAHAEIATLKGKGTRKFAHASIYRMESGRYELTVYIL